MRMSFTHGEPQINHIIPRLSLDVINQPAGFVNDSFRRRPYQTFTYPECPVQLEFSRAEIRPIEVSQFDER